MLQGVMGSIEAEVQRVEKDGNLETDRLQVEVEGLWDKVTGLQESTNGLAEITEGVRGTMERSELQVGATVLMHDLVSQGDVKCQMGLLGAYDKTKGRWSVQLPEGEKVWIKGENLWAVDGLNEGKGQHGRAHLG